MESGLATHVVQSNCVTSMFDGIATCKRWQVASHLVAPPANTRFRCDPNPKVSPTETSHAARQVWSAFREPSFGHGLMDFISDTTAVWNWQRNQDPANAKNSDTVRALAVVLQWSRNSCGGVI